MALESILEPILQGEPQTYSFTVKAADVKKGMLVAPYGDGQVQPATTGDMVMGIAMFDADVDDELTVALMGTSYIARVILAENQTITMGAALGASSTTISGTTTKGRVGAFVDPSIADLTDSITNISDSFTDWTLGATPSGTDINTAANALIDELDGLVGHLSAMRGEINTLVSSINGMIDDVLDRGDAGSTFVGYALEAVTTSSDEEKIIKVLVKGPAI